MISQLGSNNTTPTHSRSSSPTTMTNSSSSLVNLSMKDLTIVTLPSNLKLTSLNFLSWKTQVQALLYGLDLFNFLDGTHPKPTPTINADGTQIPAATYANWSRQDRLVFGALVGSLSEEIVLIIQGTDSSRDAWELLQKTYVSPTQGHLKQLKHRLKNTTKLPTQTVSDYMWKIKNITDELALLGKKMDNEDIIDVILDGLDSSQYKPILDAVHARDTTISFNELHEKLITHELCLTQQTAITGVHQPASVFHVQQQNCQGHSNRNWSPRPVGNFKPNHSHNRQGHLPTPTVSRPKQGTKPYLARCQWCYQQGHSLINCPIFKRVFPNVIIPPFNRNASPKLPQVHTMQVGTTSDQANWLFDSGASHHVTTELNNLSFHAPYDGTEELVIGDGSGPSNQNQAPPGNDGQGLV
ncbi:hypothetical protein SSX86_016586 [Deinandra increscens subsp. villosa]|uniref:Retrovirus-related Pol polyprotein from transposon RE1 n=1 Tax=Deinandra increscens subsp. villosa TaxID=3103831 RepID=A0AAP0GVT3_9ASTR